VYSRTDFVGCARVFPEASRRRDSSVGWSSAVLGGVEEAEIVGTVGIVWEVGCKERGV
jgi:hypothetical protein